MTDKIFSGRDLKGRREAMGLSEVDVYRKLRVPAGFVRAIEAGNLDQLPPLTYTTGFLKTYCSLLEVDPETYVNDLATAMRPERGFLGLKDSRDPSFHLFWYNNLVAWAGICALLLLGWLAYSLVLRPGASPAENKVQAEEIQLFIPSSESRP